jgi:hypothetical protein
LGFTTNKIAIVCEFAKITTEIWILRNGLLNQRKLVYVERTFAIYG